MAAQVQHFDCIEGSTTIRHCAATSLKKYALMETSLQAIFLSCHNTTIYDTRAYTSNHLHVHFKILMIKMLKQLALTLLFSSKNSSVGRPVMPSRRGTTALFLLANGIASHGILAT
jgi:hypothetical protein